MTERLWLVGMLLSQSNVLFSKNAADQEVTINKALSVADATLRALTPPVDDVPATPSAKRFGDDT